MNAELTSKDQISLETFVLRSRRVQAHSLVQKDEKFKDYAAGTMHLRLSENGPSLLQELPEDEEIFESFATRVRAVTLSSDDAYYRNAIQAMSRVDMERHGDKFNEKFHSDLAGLRDHWERTVNPSGNDRGWVAFRMDLRNPEPQESKATMQQLAESWMYADVVHTSVRESAIAGTDFPLLERYQAAVTYYSRIGRLIIYTGTMIWFMNQAGAIELSENCLTGEVAFPKKPNPDARL